MPVDRPRLRNAEPEPQPEHLAAFLGLAEYAIVQAPKDVTDETGESLRSAGTYYAPKLLAAVKVALSYHHQVGKGCLICGRVWPCAEGAAIIRALLGEGETDD